MSVFLPKVPAWEGFIPKDKFLVEVEPFITNQLNTLYNNQVSWQSFSSQNIPSTTLDGYYLLRAKDGNLFVKVMSKEHYNQVAEMEEIASELSRNGIKTILAIDGFPKFSTNHVMIAYPYYPHRFSNFSQSDLVLLGEEIAKLHCSLRSISKRKTIIQKTKYRESKIEEALKSFKTDDYLIQHSINQHYSRLDTSINAQVVHGDLNVGNIIFVDDRPIILDFEDTIHSFFSPIFDIAFILERFILIPIADDTKAWNLSKAFLISYMENSDKPLSIKHDSLFDTLISLSLRALGLLSLQIQQNNTISVDEWKKFHFLITHLFEKRPLIERIEKEILC